MLTLVHLLVLLLPLRSTTAAPFTGDGRQTLLSSGNPAAASLQHVHHPALQPYMKHLWRQQQAKASDGLEPLSHVIGITPTSVSRHGRSSILFEDLDLSSPFDAAQLLFHGDRCPGRVHVRVCPGTAPSSCSHLRKTSSVLRKEMPQYYVTVLKDTRGPVAVAAGDTVPLLKISMHVTAGCQVRGLLLIQYPIPQPSRPTTTHGGRARRFAPPSPSDESSSNYQGDAPADSPLCSVQPWTVSKADIGVANLITPEELSLNQCVGACTVDVSNYSNHAYIRHLYNHKHQPASQVAGPCCVPINVSPLIALLMNKQQNMELVTFHDMIVDQCGCI